MSARIPALVKDTLIRWARTSAGMDLAAHKAGVKEEKLAAWEAGTEQPTVKHTVKRG